MVDGVNGVIGEDAQSAAVRGLRTECASALSQHLIMEEKTAKEPILKNRSVLGVIMRGIVQVSGSNWRRLCYLKQFDHYSNLAVSIYESVIRNATVWSQKEGKIKALFNYIVTIYYAKFKST